MGRLLRISEPRSARGENPFGTKWRRPSLAFLASSVASKSRAWCQQAHPRPSLLPPRPQCPLPHPLHPRSPLLLAGLFQDQVTYNEWFMLSLTSRCEILRLRRPCCAACFAHNLRCKLDVLYLHCLYRSLGHSKDFLMFGQRNYQKVCFLGHIGDPCSSCWTLCGELQCSSGFSQAALQLALLSQLRQFKYTCRCITRNCFGPALACSCGASKVGPLEEEWR